MRKVVSLSELSVHATLTCVPEIVVAVSADGGAGRSVVATTIGE